MEDPAGNRLRTMLGELLDHMRGAQEVASGIAQEGVPRVRSDGRRGTQGNRHGGDGVRPGSLRRTRKRRLMVARIKEGACYSRSEALPFLSATTPSLIRAERMGAKSGERRCRGEAGATRRIGVKATRIGG